MSIGAGLLLAGTAVPAMAATPSCAARLLGPDDTRGTNAGLSPRDIIETRDFDDLTVSPDGRWAAITLRRASVDEDNYCSGVMLIPLGSSEKPRLIDVGGEPMLLRYDQRGVSDIVNGSIDSKAPVWSPDSKRIAYLRRDVGRTQVWIASVDGGAHALSRLEDDPRSIEWLSVSALRVTVRASGSARAAIEREGKGGFLYDRRFWSISEARPNPPITPLVALTLDASTGVVGPDQVLPGDPSRPASAILFAAIPGGGRGWTEPQPPRRYAGPSTLVVEVGGRRLACGTLCGPGVAGLWAPAKGELLILRGGSSQNGGRTELYRWQLGREKSPQLLLSTNDALSNCGLADQRLICGRETAVHPRTVIAIDPGNGAITRLFDPNPGLTDLIKNKVKRLRWTAADGVPSYGDLVLPADYRPGLRLPLVIVQYVSRGFLRGGTGDDYPIHLFAARGFAVLSVTRPPNPATESNAADLESYQRINIANWADRRRVLASVEAGIDAVIAKGVVDPDRIGITGLSDGSTTVQFALLNSRRIKAAAISTCCESRSIGQVVGLAYSDELTKQGYPPPGDDNPAFWQPYSLAQNARRMRTPLLMQLGDAEFRLSLETITALDQAKAPVEMYVFPDEHHVKSHPTHRLAVYERDLAWFDFWLRGQESSKPEDAAEMVRWRALKAALPR